MCMHLVQAMRMRMYIQYNDFCAVREVWTARNPQGDIVDGSRMIPG